MTKYLLTACAALALAGCGCSSTPDQAQAQPPAPQAEAKPAQAETLTVLTAKPTETVTVTTARTLAPGTAVAVEGRIGGRRDPFIAGRSAFLIADPTAIAACDVTPDDHCATPWDFCCEPKEKVAAATALVQAVDTDGKVGTAPLQGVGGIGPGSAVVITGTISPASTPENPIILAEAVFVDPTTVKP